jgi:hypothetical protein
MIPHCLTAPWEAAGLVLAGGGGRRAGVSGQEGAGDLLENPGRDHLVLPGGHPLLKSTSKGEKGPKFQSASQAS